MLLLPGKSLQVCVCVCVCVEEGAHKKSQLLSHSSGIHQSGQNTQLQFLRTRSVLAPFHQQVTPGMQAVIPIAATMLENEKRGSGGWKCLSVLLLKLFSFLFVKHLPGSWLDSRVPKKLIKSIFANLWLFQWKDWFFNCPIPSFSMISHGLCLFLTLHFYSDKIYKQLYTAWWILHMYTFMQLPLRWRPKIFSVP